MSAGTEHGLWSFGDFTVDAARRILLHGTEPVQLTPKQFDTLEYMVRNAGRVLTKEELLKALWPDSFVEDSNLSQNVFWLRKAFRNGGGDDAQTNYIVTVPGRGYRFDAEITVAPSHPTRKTAVDPALETAAPARDARNRKVLPWWPVLAATAAVAATGSFFFYARHRPQPRPAQAPAAQREIVLAAISNTTDDPALTGPLTGVLRIGLGQSPYLRVLSHHSTGQILAAMRLPADTALTPEIAAQLCQRRRATAYVVGAIASVGTTYVVTLEASDCVTNNVISSGRANAANKDGILAAFDSLLPGLRTQLGESIPSVRQFTVPVEQTTTASLSAFEAFAAGDDLYLHGQSTRAIPFYQRAVALDPNFAMAYARLGGLYSMANDIAKTDFYLTKAVKLSGSMSPRERLYIEEAYVRRVTSDLDESLRIDEQNRSLYPLDRGPWQGTDDTLVQVGRFQEAVRLGEEAIRRFPDDAVLHITLARAYLRAGNFDGLKRVAEDAARQQMESWDIHEMMWNRAVLVQDREAETAERSWITGKEDEYQALDDDAFLNLQRGRASAAEVSQRAFIAMAGRQSMLGYEDTDVGNFAFALEEMGLHKDADTLIHKWHPSAPTPEIARGLAEVGDIRAAESLGTQLHTAHPKDTLINQWVLPVMRATIDLREPGDKGVKDAEETLRPTEALGVRDFFAPYVRGKVYMREGDLAQARTQFQQIMNNPGADPFSPLFPLALLQLARVQARSGDIAGSRASYARLLTLWDKADPTLPVLVQARSESAALQ